MPCSNPLCVVHGDPKVRMMDACAARWADRDVKFGRGWWLCSLVKGHSGPHANCIGGEPPADAAIEDRHAWNTAKDWSGKTDADLNK